MLNRIRKDEGGFTLIELLVVILIIGILAAIALPSFLGQSKKGQDASAKSDARNMVSQVESCYADTQNYLACDFVTSNDPSGIADALGNTGLNVVAPSATLTAGQVKVVADGTSPTLGYVISALSKSGNSFKIEKLTSNGTTIRYCQTKGSAGCSSTAATAQGGAVATDGTW